MPPLGRPPIRGKGLATDDYRFRERENGGKFNCLYYANTNNVWLPMDDPKVQRRYQEVKQKEKEMESNWLGRLVGITLMLAVLAVPLWHWSRTRKAA